MIEINLLPEELRRREMPKLVMPDIPVTGVRTLILIVVAVHLAVGAAALFQQWELGMFKKDIDRLTRQNRETSLQKSQTVTMQKRVTLADSITSRKFYWTQLLNSLSDSTIKGIWLSRLSLSESLSKANPPKQGKTGAKGKGRGRTDAAQVLRLEGSAYSPGNETETIGRFIKELKSDPFFSVYFSNIELVNINQRKIKEHEVYDFLIECVFNTPKSGNV
ncbi:MAG: PilN domain-containing protein [Candidatus Omnitrophota bacterium]